MNLVVGVDNIDVFAEIAGQVHGSRKLLLSGPLTVHGNDTMSWYDSVPSFVNY